MPVTFQRSYKDARFIYQQVETWEKTRGLFQHEGKSGKILLATTRESDCQSKDFGEKDQPLKILFALRCHVPCIAINIEVLERTTAGLLVDETNPYFSG